MEKKNLKEYMSSRNWKIYGDVGHIMHTAYYIIKHRLEYDNVNKYIDEEIKRSSKKFTHNGFMGSGTYLAGTTFKIKVQNILSEYQ